MENSSKISISGYNLYYNKLQAIFDLNLEIRRREILAIFGPAGSGITSILRSLNRLCDLIPGVRMEGGISLDGQSIYSPEINVTELRRRVGMVFETPAALPMSVYNNVAYGPRLGSGKNKSSVMELVEESLRMAALWDEVKDRLSLPAGSLSGGQQQRLSIARVLALEPEVILLDRPCAALDPISTAMIEESLLQLKEKFTIVVAPHNIAQARRISDRAAFMLSGRLVEENSSNKLFSSPDEQQTSDYITGRFG